MYRKYWREVVRVWAKVHGFNLNLLWTSSPFLTLLGLIGIFSLTGIWRAVSFGVAGSFGFILIFSLFLIAPYKVWKRDTDSLNDRINKLIPLEKYEQEQRGNEKDWLYLVVEIIDLGKHTNLPERVIHVLFQIDSGLAYDIRPYRMWVSPILGGWKVKEPEYEIRQPPNLLRGKRTQLSTIGITIKDERLWEFVKGARQGKDITKALKVEIQLEENKPIFELESYPFHSDRVNDARNTP